MCRLSLRESTSFRGAKGDTPAVCVVPHVIQIVSYLPFIRCMMSLATQARILNFLLPGAGMGLLGKWKLAIINALVAVVVLCAAFALGGVFAEEIHYVWLVIASGSAGWAHAVAVNLSGAAEAAKPVVGVKEKQTHPSP